MQGRCAGDGCGFEGSYKASLTHVARCSRFAELYRTDPSRALDPAVEHRRVAAERKGVPESPAGVEPLAQVSGSAAIVAPPKRPARRAQRAPAGAVETVRVRGPVAIEYWEIPRGLLDHESG